MRLAHLRRKLRYLAVLVVVFVGSLEVLPAAWTSRLTGGATAMAAPYRRPITGFGP